MSWVVLSSAGALGAMGCGAPLPVGWATTDWRIRTQPSREESNTYFAKPQAAERGNLVDRTSANAIENPFHRNFATRSSPLPARTRSAHLPLPDHYDPHSASSPT